MALAVKGGSVSLALVEGPLADAELELYAQDELVLIVARAHAFTGRKRAVRVAEIAGEPFVVREEGSGRRLQVERELHAAGIDPAIACHCRRARASCAPSNSGSGSQSFHGSSPSNPCARDAWPSFGCAT
jgi:DNA-binding transcriptional LysR family regulator